MITTFTWLSCAKSANSRSEFLVRLKRQRIQFFGVIQTHCSNAIRNFVEKTLISPSVPIAASNGLSARIF